MESVKTEVLVLLDGLATAVVGPAGAAEKLPMARPNAAHDTPAFATFSVVLFLLNWLIRLAIVEPGLRCACDMRRTKATKSAQCVMEALFYGSFAVIGAYVVPAQTWVWPSNQWWDGYMEGKHEMMRSDLRCYYMLYCARYAQLLVSVLLERKRKDFLQMIIHHVVTLVISYVAYTAGFNRVGAIVMLLMDPADVLLHFAKTCKYIAESMKKAFYRAVFQGMADRLFEVFAFSFFCMRIVMFGYILWSMMVEGRGAIPNNGGVPGCICIALMWVLMGLQCYWFSLIMVVAKRLWSGHGVEDVRSDDEAEGGDESPSGSGQVRCLTSVVAGLVATVAVGLWGAHKYRATATEQSTTMGPYLEQVSADLNVLVSGLLTMMRGSTSAALLTSAPPNIPIDCGVFSVFTVAFFTFNWGMRLIFIEPMVRSYLTVTRSVATKFAQSCMEVFFYGGFAVIGLCVVPAQQWVWPSANWWIGFVDGGHEIMRADLRCYYLMYMARYFQQGISTLLEPKRKDYVEMTIHHVVTVLVIYVSYVYGWNRVGSVVMLLLDFADVPLHIAKICKYIAGATQRHMWEFMANRIFELFAVIFFVTRLVMYGYVCWSAHIEATRYWPKGLPEWTCVALLYTLLGLQLYWFTLLLRVVAKMLAGQNVEDIRSDDEDDTPASNNHQDGKKRKKKNQ